MKTILSIFIVLFSQPLSAIENLSHLDHIGTWTSAWTVLKGEKQVLVINKDNSIIFERNFNNSNIQKFKSNNVEHLDDLIIIKFKNNEGQLVLKIVMSGWHSYGEYKLYGTMYMYNEGIEYNGLTVSLKRDDQGNKH